MSTYVAVALAAYNFGAFLIKKRQENEAAREADAERQRAIDTTILAVDQMIMKGAK